MKQLRAGRGGGYKGRGGGAGREEGRRMGSAQGGRVRLAGLQRMRGREAGPGLGGRLRSQARRPRGPGRTQWMQGCTCGQGSDTIPGGGRGGQVTGCGGGCLESQAQRSGVKCRAGRRGGVRGQKDRMGAGEGNVADTRRPTTDTRRLRRRRLTRVQQQQQQQTAAQAPGPRGCRPSAAAEERGGHEARRCPLTRQTRRREPT